MPEASGAFSDGFGNPVRTGAALLSGGQDQRGDQGIPEGAGQSAQKHSGEELPGAVLRTAGHQRPGGDDVAGCDQGKAGVR